MNTNELSKLDLNELTRDEAQLIGGGESLWYWMAYGIGAVGRGAVFIYNSVVNADTETLAATQMTA